MSSRRTASGGSAVTVVVTLVCPHLCVCALILSVLGAGLVRVGGDGSSTVGFAHRGRIWSFSSCVHLLDLCCSLW